MNSLLILDLSWIVILIVLASLSKPLGEALKIRPFYRLFHGAVGMVLAGSLLDSLPADSAGASTLLGSGIISSGLRLCAALVSVVVCQRYWKWLFGEFLKK